MPPGAGKRSPRFQTKVLRLLPKYLSAVLLLILITSPSWIPRVAILETRFTQGI